MSDQQTVKLRFISRLTSQVLVLILIQAVASFICLPGDSLLRLMSQSRQCSGRCESDKGAGIHADDHHSSRGERQDDDSSRGQGQTRRARLVG